LKGRSRKPKFFLEIYEIDEIVKEFDKKYKQTPYPYRNRFHRRLRMFYWKCFGWLGVRREMRQFRRWLKGNERMSKELKEGKTKWCIFCLWMDGKTERYSRLERCSKCNCKLVKGIEFLEWNEKNICISNRERADYWKEKGILVGKYYEDYIKEKAEGLE
jgi:hypothetical protein